MRDRINRRLPRARRRAFLAAFISISCGGSFASADDPVPAGRLPPLPLESAGAMRQSPFCEPVMRDSLRLVSGVDEGQAGDATDGPLRPLRERVGLAPIRVAFGDQKPTVGSLSAAEQEQDSESDSSSGSGGTLRRVEITSSSVTSDPVQRNPYAGSSDENEAPAGGISMSLGDVESSKPSPSTRAAEVTPEPTTPHAVSLGRSARVLRVPEITDTTEVADTTVVAGATGSVEATVIAATAELADATPAVPMILEAAPIRLSRESDDVSDRTRRVAKPVSTTPAAIGDSADRGVHLRMSDHGDRSATGLTLPPSSDFAEAIVDRGGAVAGRNGRRGSIETDGAIETGEPVGSDGVVGETVASPIAVIEAVAPRLRSVDAAKPQLGRPPRVVRPPVRMTLVDRSVDAKSPEQSDDDVSGPVRFQLAAESVQEVGLTAASPEPTPKSMPAAAPVRDAQSARKRVAENELINNMEARGRIDRKGDGGRRRAGAGEPNLFSPLDGRPPVAVGATPVAFERADTEGVVSIVRPTVEPRNRIAGGASPKHSPSSPGRRMTGAGCREGFPERASVPSSGHRAIAGEPDVGSGAAALEVSADTPETRLMMEKAEVRSLTLELPVRRFHVECTETCQVVRSGGNRLKLIGTGSGVTRLVVWVEENGDDATSKPAMVFHVHVKESLDASGNDVADLTERLNDSIRLVFPSSDVRVDRNGGRLVVRGGCTDEQTATAILRLVRRSCLMPVEDAITVR